MTCGYVSPVDSMIPTSLMTTFSALPTIQFPSFTRAFMMSDTIIYLERKRAERTLYRSLNVYRPSTHSSAQGKCLWFGRRVLPPLPSAPPSLSTCRDIGKCLPGLPLCSGWSVGSPGNKPQSWFLFTVAMTTVGGVWGDGNYGLVLFKV